MAKRKEKQRQQEDRDKTLEPDNVRMPAPLMKSATTANIMKSSTSSTSVQQKERTPFRVERNKNKYNGSNGDLGGMIKFNGKFLNFKISVKFLQVLQAIQKWILREVK